ncbi:mucin-22 isoform X2 [Pocillopora verrucosa]|uniref:mucin-22 isoform X2 n=1 Tax=Pocillopora verrucosa TaxID=203993 RepID=UPI00333E2598
MAKVAFILTVMIFQGCLFCRDSATTASVTPSPAVTSGVGETTTAAVTPTVAGETTTSTTGGGVSATTESGEVVTTSAAGGGVTTTSAAGGGGVTTTSAAGGGGVTTTSVGGGVTTTSVGGGVTTSAVSSGDVTNTGVVVGVVTTTRNVAGEATATTVAGGEATTSAVVGSEVTSSAVTGGDVTTTGAAGGAVTNTAAMSVIAATTTGIGGGVTASTVVGGGATISAVGTSEAATSAVGGGETTSAVDGREVSPISTQTAPPTTSVYVDKRPGASVSLSLKITIDCSGAISVTLNATIITALLKLYNSAGFRLGGVEAKNVICDNMFQGTYMLSFYVGGPSNLTIEKVFENGLQQGVFGNDIKAENTVSTFEFQGVVIEVTPKSGECERVCCDGQGGEMIVERVCTPSDKCHGFDTSEKEDKGYCPGESKAQCKCSKGLQDLPSFALITVLGLASLMKSLFSS